MVNKDVPLQGKAGHFFHTACSDNLFFNIYSYKHNCMSKKKCFSRSYVVGYQVWDSIDCAWEIGGYIWAPYAELWQRAAVIKENH